MTVLPLWARYLIGAVILVIAGYLIERYLPMQPLAHILDIACWVVAAILVVLMLVALLRSPRV